MNIQDRTQTDYLFTSVNQSATKGMFSVIFVIFTMIYDIFYFLVKCIKNPHNSDVYAKDEVKCNQLDISSYFFRNTIKQNTGALAKLTEQRIIVSTQVVNVRLTAAIWR